jgi:hypothetical protein
MKITIESEEHSASVTCPDHLDIYEIAGYLRQLLLGFGYQPESVNEIFAEEE